MPPGKSVNIQCFDTPQVHLVHTTFFSNFFIPSYKVVNFYVYVRCFFLLLILENRSRLLRCYRLLCVSVTLHAGLSDIHGFEVRFLKHACQFHSQLNSVYTKTGRLWRVVIYVYTVYSPFVHTKHTLGKQPVWKTTLEWRRICIEASLVTHFRMISALRREQCCQKSRIWLRVFSTDVINSATLFWMC